MLIVTLPAIEGHRIEAHLGVVAGEVVYGANVFRDLMAGIRDVVGGRSGAYESVLADARAAALDDMAEAARVRGANAVVGAAFDYQALGQRDSMLMVAVTGTAVRVTPEPDDQMGGPWAKR